MNNPIIKPVALILSLIFAVMAWHFGEVAKHKAAWTFWDIAGVVAIVAAVLIILSYRKKKDQA